MIVHKRLTASHLLACSTMCTAVEWVKHVPDNAFHCNLRMKYGTYYVDVGDLDADGRRATPSFELAPWLCVGSRNKRLVHAMSEEARPWLTAAIATLMNLQLSAKVMLRTERACLGVCPTQFNEEVFEGDWTDITFSAEYVAFYRTALWHLIAKVVRSYDEEFVRKVKGGEIQLKKVLSVEVVFRLKRPLTHLA